MTWFLVAVAALWGAALASFLDVAAERAALGGPWSSRSHCERCKKKLSWWELLPVCSWLFLQGRCSTCKNPIPVRHVMGEVLSGALFGVFAYVREGQILSGEPFLLAAIALQFIVVAALVFAFIADVRFTIIPDGASVALVLTALGLVLLRFFGGEDSALLQGLFIPKISAALYGVLVAVSLLGSFTVVSKGAWMGLGDVKLALGFGLLFGLPLVLFVLGVSFVIGAAGGLTLVLVQQKSLKSTMPFGPYLVAAALFFMFVPQTIVWDILDFFLLADTL